MKKKIAIVTGGSDGVGKGVAIYLAKQNYHVIVIARSEQKLKNVVEAIKQNGNSSEMYQLDVADAESVSSVINSIIHDHDKIDLLFNNAAISKFGTTDISNHDLDAMLKTNLNGAIYVAKNVAAYMKKQKSGYIINMSSIGGKTANSFAGVYAASKFGLAGYSEALMKEMSQYGVKVTTICPGMIATDMVVNNRTFPSEKMLQVDDIVKTVDYLLQLSCSALPSEIIIYPMTLVEKVAALTKDAYELS